MAYNSTADIIRGVDDVFNNDDGESPYSDEELLQWATNYADPVIDSKLLACDYTVPLAVPGALILLIEALYTVAFAFDGMIAAFSGTDTDRSKALKKRADDYMNEICTGARRIPSTPSATSREIEVDPSPQLRPAYELCVTEDPTNWDRGVTDERLSY